MAKKKKKSKKQRHAETKKIREMTPEHLLALADNDMETGNIRNAISLYKLALKNQGEEAVIHPLLFNAYLARSRQLQAKGMDREAAAVLTNAGELTPDPGAMTEKDLLSGIETLDLDSGMRFYKDFAQARGGLVSAEKILAGRLALENDLTALDILDDDSPLKTHADDLDRSLSLMKQSAWKDALTALGPLPRSSPWSDLKVFCKAMVSFGEGDDTSLIRCLSSLSGSSVFPETVSAWQACVTGRPHQFPEDSKAAGLFFEGDHHELSQIRRLAGLISGKDTKKAAPLINELAQTLSPGHSREFIMSLMNLVWHQFLADTVRISDIVKLTNHVLPRTWSDLVRSKAFFNHAPDLLSSACEYLDLIDMEFKDEVENAMARSEVFSRIAEKLLDDPSDFYTDPWNAHKLAVAAEFENAPSCYYTTDQFCFTLLCHAVRIDPDNRKAYEMISRFSPFTVKAKELETVFEAMMSHFPEDPFPCLKLADLYDRKSAYRKAETVLKEAMKRAPHDRAVHDRYALSFVVAAEKNMKPGKLHLSEADLSKAEAMNVPSLSMVIAGKKMVMDCMKTKKPDPEILVKTHASGLTFHETLRCLAHVLNDLDRKELPAGPWSKLFKSLLKKSTDTLMSAEIASLLRPVNEAHQAVYPFMRLCDTFLTHGKHVIKALSDEDLIRLLGDTALVSETFIDDFAKEFKQRFKRAKKETKTIFSFCLSALNYIEGDDQAGRDLEHIAETASSDITARLKAISRQFALIADQDIRGQFYHFDFYSPTDETDFPDLFRLLMADDDDDDPEEYGDDDVDAEEDNEDDFVPPVVSRESLVAELNDICDSLSPRSPLPQKRRLITCVDKLLFLEGLIEKPDHEILEARRRFLSAFPFLGPDLANGVSALGPSIMVNLPRETYTFLTGLTKPDGGI